MIPYVRKILRVRFKFQIKKWITLIRQRKINLDNNAVLVVGGGIAGIQASLDLADRGACMYEIAFLLLDFVTSGTKLRTKSPFSRSML